MLVTEPLLVVPEERDIRCTVSWYCPAVYQVVYICLSRVAATEGNACWSRSEGNVCIVNIG